MQLLHESPVLARSAITTSLIPRRRWERPSAGAARVGRLRPGRSGGADQDHAGVSQHRRNVETVDRSAVPLPSHRGLSGDRGVHRIVVPSARRCRCSAWPVDPALDSTAASSSSRASCRLSRRSRACCRTTNSRPPLLGRQWILPDTISTEPTEPSSYRTRVFRSTRRCRPPPAHRAPPCSSWFRIFRWAFINWRFASPDPENRIPAPAISWLCSSVRKSSRLCRSTWPATEQEQRASRWIASRKSDPASKCRYC